MRPQTNERDYDCNEFWSSVDEHTSGACMGKLCLYCVSNGVSLETQKRERLIETRFYSVFQRDAYLRGESIGRARYHNGSLAGNAKGTGLRGIERRAYEEGLRQGWANAQSEHVSKQIYTMQRDRRFC